MPERFQIELPDSPSQNGNGRNGSVRLVRYSPMLDTFRRYVTDSPSPEKFAQYLKDAERGDLAAMCEMQQEMEAKDLWLQGVVETRRGALTALEWDIEPNLEQGDEAGAKLVADYCRSQLLKMKSWPDTLEHFGTAYGPNVAITELVWSNTAELVDTVDVPCHRLRMRPWINQEPWIETDEDILGIPLRSPSYGIAPKFVLFHVRKDAGFPFRRTLTHGTVWPWLVIRFSRTDWMAFSELYGTPLRVAEYDDSVVDADRTTVKTGLEQMGPDTVFEIPTGINIKLLTADGNGETFERQMQWAQSVISVGWLGQTLTTDVGDRGSFAAAKVHDNVRADLLLADMAREKRLIESQVLEPMVALKFPGREALRPLWVRRLNESKNVEAARLRKDQLFAARELGLPVNTDEAYDVLDLARPEEEADVIAPKTESEPENNEQPEPDRGEAVVE